MNLLDEPVEVDTRWLDEMLKDIKSNKKPKPKISKRKK